MPDFVFDSVPAFSLRPGDRVSWNVGDRAEVCEVVESEPNHGARRWHLKLDRPGGGTRLDETVLPNLTVNRVADPRC